MARSSSKPADVSVSFDDLLDANDTAAAPDVEVVQGTVNGIPVGEPEVVSNGETVARDAPVAIPTETAAQRRIRELQEQLAAIPLDQTDDDGLTEEERTQIKQLEDRLARSRGEKVDRDAGYSAAPVDGEKILIHFVVDGFSAFGNVWALGQEVEVTVGSEDYKRTVDIAGNSWLDIRNDSVAQRRKWGREVLREGPYVWVEGEEFDVEVAKQDARRGRAVPVSTY